MPFYTDKLHLKLIQPQDMFADESFNNVIKDADDKLVGVAHLPSGAHWQVWEKDTVYAVNDVVRWPSLHGHQYARCRQAGTSGTTTPVNNVTGSIITDNTVKWEVMSISDNSGDGGTILIWLSGAYYSPGDAVFYGKSLYRCRVQHQATTFDSDKANWHEVYASVRPWVTGIFYSVGDSIINNHEIYECITEHVAGASFNTTEKVNWVLVGSFGLVSEWAIETKYHVGQIVTYEGLTFICTTEHESNNGAFENDIVRWKLFTAGITPWGLSDYYPLGAVVVYDSRIWRCIYAHNRTTAVFEDTQQHWTPLGYNLPAYLKAWQPNTYYYLHQTVLIENKYLYKCTTSHTSDVSWSLDETHWIRLGGIEGVVRDWESGVRYYPNQLVTYLGTLYRAVAIHDSGASFEQDVAEWRRINANIGYWEINKYYPQYHLVEYNNMIYRCSTAHASTSTFDVTKWTPLLAFPVIDEWQPNNNYLENQVIKFNNMLLIAVDTHTSDSTGIINDLTAPNIHWNLVYTNIQTWQANTTYKVGTQVIYNNNLYQAKDTHTSGSTFDITHWELIGQFDAFVYDWQANKYYYANQVVIKDKELYRSDSNHTSANTWNDDKVNWTKISSAVVIDNWADNTEYLLNEVVIWNGVLYRCNTAHTSSTTFDGAKFTTVYANVAPWQASTQYLVGQLVMYNNQLYKCITAHTSQSAFESDGAKWQPVANNIVGIPAWAEGIYYYPNQVVKYNGKIWRCLTAHTSGVNDSPDNVIVYEKNQSHFFEVNMSTPLPAEYILDIGSVNPITKIRLSGNNSGIDISGKIYISIDGTNYTDVGDFSAGNHSGSGPTINLYANVRYIKIQVTSRYDGYGYGGSVYFSQAVVNGLSTKWEIIVDDGVTITYWTQNNNYDVNDIVIYNDELYRCIEKHASGSTFDITKWVKISETVIHDWAIGKEYKIDNVVWYGNSVCRCLINHTSDSTENPYEKEAYVASSNTVDIDDTTTIPYNEVIDLSSVQTITNITYLEVKTQMDAVYKIEVSSDNVTYNEWEGEEISARYVRVTIESISIDAGASAPNFYLDDFTVYTKSTKWQEISTMNTLTNEEIDAMFI